MSIYLNNKEWTGEKNWQEQLGKGFKLKKSVKFYLTPQYQGQKQVDDKPVTTYPESYNLPPAYSTIMDGQAVEIRYVTKPTPVRGGKKGEVTMGFLPQGIIFRNGVLEVKKNEVDLYYFLITHPRCETNPAYFTEDKKDKNKLKPDDSKITLALSSFSHFIFRERNETLEQEIAYDKREAVITAQNFIVTSMTKDEIIAAYKNYETDWDEDMPLPRMKNFLLAKAEENPKDFMDQLDDNVRTYKTKVNEAVAAEVIFFDKPKKIWKFAGAGGGSKIIAVAKGKDPILELVKHLRDVDSGELLEAIEKAVKEKEELVEG